MILRRILLKLYRRRRLERDLEAELAFHRDLARENSNPVGLGNVGRIQEEARDLWRFTLLEDFCRDLVYTVRALRQTPGFTVVAVLTLALGIGANTAIFTLIHRVMLAPLPVKKPGELIELLGTRGNGPPGSAFSYAALQTLRNRTQACSYILGFSNFPFHAVIEGEPMERVTGQFVTADYFSGLGISIALGRSLLPEDDKPGGASAAAVISDSLWRSRYGGNRAVIGKTIQLENVPFTIVGVAPSGFYGAEVGRRNNIWVPLESERLIRRPSFSSSSGYKWLQMIGRLKPGSTIEQAQAELRTLYRESVIANEIAELAGDPRFTPEAANQMQSWSTIIVPAGTGLSRARDQYRLPLLS